MRQRGVVEGFYGPPWSATEEMDQMEFYGRLKVNSFIYAPKDDPYHRDDWRRLFDKSREGQLTTLVEAARDRHIEFTYALAPGLSICYTSADDYDALTAKLRSMYDIGVRSFSIPLDDVWEDKWNCPEDERRYGPWTEEHLAQAQVELLNKVQGVFLPGLQDVRPLQTVPAEYFDVKDTPYKKAYREYLDKRVVMMWTGVGVTPTSIEVAEAADAEQVWGRKPLVWDNYPTTDFDTAAGRMLFGPYAERKPGIGAHLTGIIANPMEFAYASKPGVFGVAGFAWNDGAYDPAKSTRQYAEWLGGGDEKVVTALMAFFDLNHLAPVLDEPGQTWQPQAPELARRIASFREKWAAGEHGKAIDELTKYAETLAQAPGLIRTATTDDGFAQDATDWLDAADLWAQALLTTLKGLASRAGGDDAGAERWFAEAADLTTRAEDVVAPTRFESKVKIGDGVLDTFIREAPALRR